MQEPLFVKITATGLLLGAQFYPQDSVVEVDKAIGERLVKSGHAVLSVGPAVIIPAPDPDAKRSAGKKGVETAAVTPATEKATA